MEKYGVLSRLVLRCLAQLTATPYGGINFTADPSVRPEIRDQKATKLDDLFTIALVSIFGMQGKLHKRLPAIVGFCCLPILQYIYWRAIYLTTNHVWWPIDIS
jgi:hypothetical protein